MAIKFLRAVVSLVLITIIASTSAHSPPSVAAEALPEPSTSSVSCDPSEPSELCERSIPALPDTPELNFDLIQKNAEEFYATLPQTISNDATLMVPELIKKYGYPCEVHRVITSDGYILNMHRIPYGQTGNSENRPVVYLQHGILASSADWIVSGPEKGLGYILADAGYDVWLANVRGTRYSRDHVDLDPDSAQFWGFSWHEIAIHDVTAMIDYALNQTKQEKLFYVGHSQGTTLFYVMCSEKPEYNNKITAQFSLAPLAYMSHMRSPILQAIARHETSLEFLSRFIGINEFLPKSGFLAQIGKTLCGDPSPVQILCTNALFVICGFNPKQVNTTLLPVIMGHTPAGAATKQFLHYAQEINSGKFRQWDYGFFGNIRHYHSYKSPRYKLSKVTAPVYLYYSENDWLSDESDVLRLYVELANVKDIFLIADESFNHVDYLYAIGARKLVYDPLIAVMKNLSCYADCA